MVTISSEKIHKKNRRVGQKIAEIERKRRKALHKPKFLQAG
jgi:hypothetical protein